MADKLPTLSRASTATEKSHIPAHKDSDFVLELPSIPPPDVKGELEQLNAYHKPFQFEVQQFNATPNQTSMQFSTAPPPLQTRKITMDHAENLLSTFKKQMHYFPFVQIPMDASVPVLSRTSPFLLLAILCAASVSDASLHHQIDYEFRRVLGLKLIVDGEKSLDYLQGLLIYIAW